MMTVLIRLCGDIDLLTSGCPFITGAEKESQSLLKTQSI
jgi:hypothetical protein